MSKQADPEAPASLAREAAAAIADCAANAAPYEQRDFARRLTQIGTEYFQMAPITTELQYILTNNPDTTPTARRRALRLIRRSTQPT